MSHRRIDERVLQRLGFDPQNISALRDINDKTTWTFTDNGVIRANGTDDIQSSTATIDDSGNLIVNGDITATGDLSVDNLSITTDLSVGGDISVTGESTIGKGLTRPITTISTTSVTLDETYYTVLVDDDTAGGDVTITLPISSGRIYRIKKLGTTGDVLFSPSLTELSTGLIAQYVT